jgi:nucleotide-binding universal stress UspA family protein
MTEPRTILHPTDFSPEAAAAEAEAVRLARALDADLVLLHVSVETPLYSETPFGAADLEKIYASQARWVEDRLTERTQRLQREGVRVRWVRRVGVPYEEIVRAAKDERATYIVIGTHGRGGFERLMLGSVADRVVRAATCPVITVRPVPTASAP